MLYSKVKVVESTVADNFGKCMKSFFHNSSQFLNDVCVNIPAK